MERFFEVLPSVWGRRWKGGGVEQRFMCDNETIKQTRLQMDHVSELYILWVFQISYIESWYSTRLENSGGLGFLFEHFFTDWENRPPRWFRRRLPHTVRFSPIFLFSKIAIFIATAIFVGSYWLLQCQVGEKSSFFLTVCTDRMGKSWWSALFKYWCQKFLGIGRLVRFLGFIHHLPLLPFSPKKNFALSDKQ